MVRSLLALGFALLAACGTPAATEDLAPIRGLVEAPPGFRLDGLFVQVAGKPHGGRVAADGSFSIPVPAHLEAVDLQVIRPRRLRMEGVAGRMPTTEEFLKALRRTGSERFVAQVDGHEGAARSVRPGTDDVRIVLRPQTTTTLDLRVLTPAGTPAAGRRVVLRSMGDSIPAVTGTDGTVRIQDVPVRAWRANVHTDGVLFTEHTVEAGPDAVTLRLRAPWTVFVELDEQPAENVFLMVGNVETRIYHTAPWRPGADARQAIRVDPSVTALEVQVHAWSARPDESVELARGRVTVRDGAVLRLATGD